MRTFKAEGIVIKRKDFYEADRILTIFTKTRGKIQVKAKGVRKITSRRSGHIELLNYAVFNLYQASGAKSMPILTEVESRNNYAILKKDLRKVGIAFHVCELVDALCAENQENEEIFTLLTQALEMISKDDRLDLISHRFELKLLKLLGFSTDSHKLNKEETENFIESILERRLKTKQILPQLS
jgi:DNA repair protein RecO (recombination protein O)